MQGSHQEAHFLCFLKSGGIQAADAPPHAHTRLSPVFKVTNNAAPSPAIVFTLQRTHSRHAQNRPSLVFKFTALCRHQRMSPHCVPVSMATQDASWTSLTVPQHGAGMECSRCRSRHEAHRHKIDSKPDTLRARGHGREAARVIQEGVSRWTFPSRTSSRPQLLGPPEGTAQSWSPGNSWNLQIQHSIPDMEGVVGEDLRLRIERVLAFPMGRGEAEEHVPDTTSINGHPGDARSPAGGLLQEYLDQLEPEEEEGMEEEEDELLFQGSESDRESEADLIYDSDKEQYTTPYLLFLQHARTSRRDARREPEPCPDDLQPQRHLPSREEKEDEEDGSSGERDGAVGRSGHRSSRATSSRTPPTLASVTRELTDSKSNNRDHETSISSDRGSKTGDSAPLRNSSPLSFVPLPASKNEEAESETEDQPEEEGGDKVKQEEKDEKRKKRKRKKKKRKMKKTKSKGETTEEEEEEREREQEDEQRKGSKFESPEMRVESLRKSTALVLFRNFAKTVYAPRHSQFKLFSSLEDLEEVSPSTGPLPPAAKGTPRP
ncbi:ABC transporter F family member 4-like isoform X2 [Scylla paramamosain]|uniref:ABC transporter F family member 4-like isoform X2 n=1 Tax=Scylla paramamosain TaxID=85552 RepID=UPI0030833B0C